MVESNNTNKPTSKDYTSQLKPYSLGVLTAHKENGTGLIDVQPIEINWASNGEIVNNYSEETVEGKDKEGQDINYKIISSNNLTAAWLPLGNSNRVSPPELRRGMIVMIYKDSDNNYYWVDSGLNREYMRAESATYGFCANPEPTKNSKVSHDDWYILEVSPRTHQIMLSTSQANGEYTSYSIVLNTQAGFLKITDGFGNFITMDSRNIQHRLENQRGTFIEMLGEDINIYAPKNINIKAGKDINIESGSNMNIGISSKFEISSGSDYSINTKANYSMVSSTYTYSATNGIGTAHGQGMRIEGQMSSGSVKTDNNIDAGSNIHAGGNITAGGKIDCKH